MCQGCVHLTPEAHELLLQMASDDGQLPEEELADLIWDEAYRRKMLLADKDKGDE